MALSTYVDGHRKLLGRVRQQKRGGRMLKFGFDKEFRVMN